MLGETLADRTDRVRRRAMATLGELLFYVATQQADTGQACVWQVTSSTLAIVKGLLQNEDDDITQVKLQEARCVGYTTHVYYPGRIQWKVM